MRNSSILFVLILVSLCGLVACDEPTSEPLETLLTETPNALTNQTNSTFAFTATLESATFTCQLDDEAEFACGSPLQVTTVIDGTHTFKVRATTSGAVDPTPATYTWVVDRTPPNATIVAAPSSITSATEARFEFTSTESNSVFMCKIDMTTEQMCVSGTRYSNLTEGAHTFSVHAIDRADNPGPTSEHEWTVDTTNPALVVVTAPGPSPYTSSDTEIIIAGSCEESATVRLVDNTTGSSLSTVCAGLAYSFSITKTEDGLYGFSLSQTDRAANPSGTTTWQWQRDLKLPATPTITLPALSPHISNENSITIAGNCVAGLTVTLGGATTSTSVCSSAGTYSFNVSKSVDDTYVFTVKQTSLTGIDSGTAATTWIRDTSSPEAPTRVSPAQTPYTSRDTLLTIAGTCETGATVTLREGSAIAATGLCLDANYSVDVSKSIDGEYDFSIFQTDRAGNPSNAIAFRWVRDTITPLLSAVSPASGGLSGGTHLTLTGLSFVPGASVAVGGTPCSNVVVNAPTEIVCDTPSYLVARAVDVVVTNPDGRFAVGSGLYNYTGLATYGLLKNRIFMPRCAGCHSGPSAFAGLDVLSYPSISNRVTPGNAATSRLYLRVTTQAPIMPRNAPPLSDDEKQAIADWINSGAVDN